MKQQYEAPALVVHGTVEGLTAAFGPSTLGDVIFVGSTAVDLGTLGSRPGCVTDPLTGEQCEQPNS